MSPPQPQTKPNQRSEDETHMLEKREKARERQRRKRARDKSASALVSFLESNPDASKSDLKDRELAMQASGINKRVGNGRGVNLDALPPGEAARRERIRIAARERQRRHRAGVKAKRMAELGMAIVNSGGGVEQTAIGYTINENGQYEAVLADTTQNPPPMPPSYVVPHATPGQTFSSTLFHALSCTPLLKQHLLRTLRFNDEELAAFEPVIAAAFDHWDHGRALYYAAHGYQTTSSYVPPIAPHQQPYGLRHRHHRPIGSLSLPLKAQHDADESLSASDESHHSDEDGHGDGQSEQPESFPACATGGRRNVDTQRGQGEREERERVQEKRHQTSGDRQG